MKNKTLLLLAMFALPFTAQAGGSELHGGDSVVCFQTIAQKQQVEKVLRQNKVANQMGYVRHDPFDDIDLNTVTVETLDIWEAKNVGIKPRTMITVKNLEESVKERLDILDTKMAFMSQVMREAYEGFYAPSKWLASTTGIVEIDDSRELINYTKLCIPVQIAVQTNTRVYFDARLFSKMNETNKTALVLHELLYSWLKKMDENSLNVRKYVGIMMLENFSSYPATELIQEFNADYPGRSFSTEISCPAKTVVDDMEIEFNAILIGLNTQACKKESIIRRAIYKNKDDLVTLSKKLGYEVSNLQRVSDTWSPDGLIPTVFVILKADQVYHVVETVTDFKIETAYTSLPVVEGAVVGLPTTTYKMELLGQEIKVERNLNYSKLPSGENYLSSFKINGEYTLKSVSGFKKVKKCKNQMMVYLNPNGLVTECKYE